MPKKKNDISGIEYLERMLQWDAFAKEHPKFRPALQEALDELYRLREQVQVKN